MNEFLRGNMFGMPRWLWLTLLAAGVAGGLYLRNRNKQKAAAANGADPNAIDPQTGLPYSQETSAYDPSLDPSLAGLGAYPSGGGGSSGYENSYAMDLLSQLLSQQGGGSANTADDVLSELQNYEQQQAQYDADLQGAIQANNKQLQQQIKKQQQQLQRKIKQAQKRGGKSRKPGHKTHTRAVGPHAGSGQRGRPVHDAPAQGKHQRRNVAHGRTSHNTPTGGGPPARPPHAHMPVHTKHKK